MSIIFKTDNPQVILNKLDRLIENREIRSWLGNQYEGYIHKSKNFNAMVVASSENDKIIFDIIEQKNEVSYAEYHGYLLTTLMKHFNEFTKFKIYTKPSE